MVKAKAKARQDSLVLLDGHHSAQILEGVVHRLHPFALSGVSPLDHLRGLAVHARVLALLLLLAGRVVRRRRAEAHAGAVAALQPLSAVAAAAAAVDDGLLATVRVGRPAAALLRRIHLCNKAPNAKVKLSWPHRSG